ncbi:MAG: enolase C-terminal domain-like protein [Candidatus Rokuibacteriota bacterium]
MKITDVHVWVVAPYRSAHPLRPPPGGEEWARQWEFGALRILTDGGVEGNAFVWGATGAAPAAQTIVQAIRPELIGQDPLDRERLWHRIRRVDRLVGLFARHLHGPVDVALWDIAAKAAGLPLYRLLGAYRERLPVYGASLFLSDVREFVAQAERCRAQKLHGYKLHPPGDPALDVSICRTVREAVGDAFPLMVDCHASYTQAQALAVGRALDELGFTWYEEPLPDAELQGYVELCRALDTPVAALQTLPAQLPLIAEYLRQGAVDVVLADTSWKSGVTGLRKIAALCEGFGVSCEIHSGFNALCSVANLHVACSVRNGEFFEAMIPAELFDFGLAAPLRIDGDGYVRVPEGPGLGVEVDWALLERHTLAKL